jgi:hypothetical protein
VACAANLPNEPILPLPAHSTNGSNAQEASFAKPGRHPSNPTPTRCNAAQKPVIGKPSGENLS